MLDAFARQISWEIDNFKIKVVTFIICFVENISLEIDKCKSKAEKAASVSVPIVV